MVFFVEDGKRDPRGFMARPGQILNVAELPARIADVLQSRPSDWRRRRVKAAPEKVGRESGKRKAG